MNITDNYVYETNIYSAAKLQHTIGYVYKQNIK
jgi:hypothetical protein